MANTHTATPESILHAALASVSRQFRTPLIDRYRSLKAAYSRGDHDACGLRAGHFCEAMLRLLQDQLTGTHIPFGKKVPNFGQECARLANTPQAAAPESVRVIIPQAISFMYTFRNKRGIGHIGGDVDANAIDAATMVRLADWCLCELVRVVHNLSLEEAQALLDAVSERQLADVWSVVGKKRVLDPSLDSRSQTLLLLYSDVGIGVAAEDLFEWIEYSTLSNFRRDVLRPMHAQRLIEYDRETETAILSPRGIAMVETEILVASRNTSGTAPRTGRRRSAAS